MLRAARDLEFERAAELRDRLVQLRRRLDETTTDGTPAGAGPAGNGRSGAGRGRSRPVRSGR